MNELAPPTLQPFGTSVRRGMVALTLNLDLMSLERESFKEKKKEKTSRLKYQMGHWKLVLKTNSSVSCLQRYVDAENAFEQVLHLDKNCEEAVEELRRVRGYQLMVRLLLHHIYTVFHLEFRYDVATSNLVLFQGHR